MTARFGGGCLCGAVRYESRVDPLMAGHCHCADCRKSSGTGHCSHLVAPGPSVTVTGRVTIYDRPADSGNIVSRAFCPVCGTPIYSLNGAMPDLIFLRASSLDDPEIFKPQMVVYTKRAPSWDHMDSRIPSFSTMPPSGPPQAGGDR
jgi:hypothetical protein